MGVLSYFKGSRWFRTERKTSDNDKFLPQEIGRSNGFKNRDLKFCAPVLGRLIRDGAQHVWIHS
jgi:hypothetical protein